MENILNNANLSLYHLPRRRGCARCLGFRRWGGILANSVESLISNPRTRCWRGKKENENDVLWVCSPSYTFFYIIIVHTHYGLCNSGHSAYALLKIRKKKHLSSFWHHNSVHMPSMQLCLSAPLCILESLLSLTRNDLG